MAATLTPVGLLVQGLLLQLFAVVQTWLSEHGDELGGEDQFLDALQELLDECTIGSDGRSSGAASEDE